MKCKAVSSRFCYKTTFSCHSSHPVCKSLLYSILPHHSTISPSFPQPHLPFVFFHFISSLSYLPILLPNHLLLLSCLLILPPDHLLLLSYLPIIYSALPLSQFLEALHFSLAFVDQRGYMTHRVKGVLCLVMIWVFGRSVLQQLF